jgi:hypothetical protein
METVLVTAGAGFIGSHICKALAAHGFLPVAFNDLSRGHADFVRWGPLVNGTSRLQSMFGMCVVSPVLDGSGADVRRVSVLRWTRSAQRRCMLSASTVKHWTAQVLPPRPACMGRPMKPRINHDPVKLLDRSSSRHYPWRSASKPAPWHQCRRVRDILLAYMAFCFLSLSSSLVSKFRLRSRGQNPNLR